jgi:hypothetical protein
MLPVSIVVAAGLLGLPAPVSAGPRTAACGADAAAYNGSFVGRYSGGSFSFKLDGNGGVTEVYVPLDGYQMSSGTYKVDPPGLISMTVKFWVQPHSGASHEATISFSSRMLSCDGPQDGASVTAIGGVSSTEAPFTMYRV